MRLPLLLVVPILACSGSAAPIASTTGAHKKPDYAPPPPDTGAQATTGTAPIPPADDASERLFFVKAGSIWSMKPDGSEALRLTVKAGAAAADDAPSVSPGGTEIAYSSARDGVNKIFVTSVDGVTTRTITDGAGGGDTSPSWLADGPNDNDGQVVFVRGKENVRRDLYAVPATGGTPRLILEGDDDAPAFAGFPAVSPDGKWIAFSSDRRGGLGTGIWLIAPDGSGLKRLTRPPRSQGWFRDLRPAWSPDGARIAFASNRHAASADTADDLDVYSVELASGTITRLTNDLAVADDPTWSPDGKRIFFTSTRDATREYSVELYVMPSGGGEQMRLTRDAIPENRAPAAGRVR